MEASSIVEYLKKFTKDGRAFIGNFPILLGNNTCPVNYGSTSKALPNEDCICDCESGGYYTEPYDSDLDYTLIDYNCTICPHITLKCYQPNKPSIGCDGAYIGFTGATGSYDAFTVANNLLFVNKYQIFDRIEGFDNGFSYNGTAFLDVDGNSKGTGSPYNSSPTPGTSRGALIINNPWGNGSAFDKNGVRFRNNKKTSAVEDFSVYYEFTITPDIHASYTADGIVFVIQSLNYGVGDSGGGIGYSGITSSVGIKYDIWCNNSPPEINEYPRLYAPGFSGQPITSNYVGLVENGNIYSHGDSYVQCTLNPGESLILADGKKTYNWVDYNKGKWYIYISKTPNKPSTPIINGYELLLGDTNIFFGCLTRNILTVSSYINDVLVGDSGTFVSPDLLNLSSYIYDILAIDSGTFVSPDLLNISSYIYNILEIDSGTLREDITTTVVDTTYTSFESDTKDMTAYIGRNVSLQLYRGSLVNKDTMDYIVSKLDLAYDCYYNLIGETPIPVLTLNGRDLISEVSSTCGSGCSYLGSTGMELLDSAWTTLYNSVTNDDQFDQVLFYEFGRNFWVSSINKIECTPGGTIATGFAVFLRFISMDYANVSGALFNGHSFSLFKNEVIGLLTTYTNNPSYNWTNTVYAGVAPTNTMGLGGTDMWASFMFDMYYIFGNTFLNNIWKNIKTTSYSSGSSIEAANGTFVIAASNSVGLNLYNHFHTTYRWPLLSDVNTILSFLPTY